MITEINKKSQGTTLTWFIATIIIFFIMVLFLSASVIISGSKAVSSGKDEIGFESSEGNIKSLRGLNQLLNSKIIFNGKEKIIKDILKEVNIQDIYSASDVDSEIKLDLRDKIREKIKTMVGNTGKNCYYFQAIWGYVQDPEEVIAKADPRASGAVGAFVQKSSITLSNFDNSINDPRMNIPAAMATKLAEKSSDIVIITDYKKNIFGVEEASYQGVYVKFYLGEC
jgi:hypothetical protein